MSIYAIPITSAQCVFVESTGSTDEVAPTSAALSGVKGTVGKLLEVRLRAAAAPVDALVLRATGGAANAGGRFVGGAIFSPIAVPSPD